MHRFPLNYPMRSMQFLYSVFAVLFLALLTSAENQTTYYAAANASSPAYACMRERGYNPESVVFVYSNGRGGSRLLTYARTTSRREGVEFINLNNGLLKDNEIRLLECFFGKYRPGNREFSRAPRLLCARKGVGQQVYMHSVGMREFSLFTKRCMD